MALRRLMRRNARNSGQMKATTAKPGTFNRKVIRSRIKDFRKEYLHATKGWRAYG